MSNPTLVKTKIIFGYTASDGYRMEYGAKAGKGSKNIRGEEVPAEAAFLDALEELARLTALFGFENQAKERFESARARVAEWKTGGAV
jgi:hypothetical protein